MFRSLTKLGSVALVSTLMGASSASAITLIAAQPTVNDLNADSKFTVTFPVFPNPGYLSDGPLTLDYLFKYNTAPAGVLSYNSTASATVTYSTPPTDQRIE